MGSAAPCVPLLCRELVLLSFFFLLAACEEATSQITANNCKCKQNWIDTAGHECNDYCCNPDNKSERAWCQVEDLTCENAGWGWCVAPAAVSEPERDPNCTDQEGWHDLDGDGCPVYARNQYCTKDGKTGPGWREEEWGTLGYYTANGYTAFTACCACGGGKRDSDHIPGVGTKLSADVHGEVRTTHRNCNCKKQWNLEGGGECNEYCCNPDGDPIGAWCMVEDPSCEESYWGYCQPSDLGLAKALRGPPQDAAHCQDITAWVDKDGDGCTVYAESMFCTASGENGPGWQEEWGSLGAFRANGFTALTACCCCGGGKRDSDKAPGEGTSADVPKEFVV